MSGVKRSRKTIVTQVSGFHIRVKEMNNDIDDAIRRETETHLEKQSTSSFTTSVKLTVTYRICYLQDIKNVVHRIYPQDIKNYILWVYPVD